MNRFLVFLLLGLFLIPSVAASGPLFWGRNGWYFYRDFWHFPDHRMPVLQPIILTPWAIPLVYPTQLTPLPYLKTPLDSWQSNLFPSYVNQQLYDLDQNEVLIQNSAFIPSTVRIKVGDRVVWKNKDLSPEVILGVHGTEGLDSGILAPGASYSKTFNREGTYDYFCTLHPWMKGWVVVS